MAEQAIAAAPPASEVPQGTAAAAAYLCRLLADKGAAQVEYDFRPRAARLDDGTLVNAGAP